jgi:predicted lipoprotein with Yx(FWY)xxD motif
LGLAACAAPDTAGAPAAPRSAPLGELGFAITSFKTAGLETPYLEECPRGVAIGNDEIWWKSLSPRDRDRLTDGGEKEPSARRVMATLRGPRGEDVCWNPQVVQDPPLRTVESARAIGFNLDGTIDGEATPKSCRHRKFVGTDGVASVDHQMWRLVGCIHGWRANGYIENTADTERRNSSLGVILVRVAGVRTLEDSPAVTVSFHRSADVMPKDSAGHILPFASYRIDGNPRYGATAKGRIRNGVLTTEPVDVRLPYFGNRVETEFVIRDLRLELKLSESDARGLIGGYQDLENWWSYVRRMGYLVETAQFSCPALHAAARELADGYPDPRTGECTALSVAYAVEGVRAFVNLSPKPIAVPIAVDARATARVAAELPPGLRVARVRGAEVVTTAAGRTLHVSAGEQADCVGECARDFLPLRAPWGAVARGAWQVRAMADGTLQWAHGARPVFACAREAAPGDFGCVRDGWQPLTLSPAPVLPPGITVQPSEMGPVIADGAGRSLYRLLGSRADFEREICDGTCFAAQWRPALARLAPARGSAQGTAPDPARTAAGALSVMRVGTADVWAFQGSPLYTFVGDEGPGQIAGHRFGGASVSAKNWLSVVTLEDAMGVAAAVSKK